MTIQTIEPTVQAALDQCQQAGQHFEAARDTYRNLRNQQSTHLQSAEAAEASALSIKGQAQQLLRQLMGRPSKELHELRAGERAAYSLAEDYRSFATEMALQVDESELATSIAKMRYQAGLNTLRSKYSQVIWQAALDSLEPILKAVCLRERVLVSEGPFATWQEQGYATAFDATWAELSHELCQRAKNYQLASSDDPVLKQITTPEGLQDFPSYSHLQLNRKRAELAARREAMV